MLTDVLFLYEKITTKTAVQSFQKSLTLRFVEWSKRPHQIAVLAYNVETFLFLEGTGQLVHTLYRGQGKSASEVDQLKKRISGSIAMSSFVSATRNPDVAESFAGNGEERPDMESVIFEIFLGESDKDCGRSPFADISDLSINEDEEEGLLCLGAVLRFESVEVEEQVTWVRVRMCPREDNEPQRQLATGFDRFINPDYLNSERVVLDHLSMILFCTDEPEKCEQILKILLSSMGSSGHPLEDLQRNTLLLCAQSAAKGFSEVPDFSIALGQLRKTSMLFHSLIDSSSSQHLLHDAMVACKAYCDGISEMIEGGADRSSLMKF